MIVMHGIDITFIMHWQAAQPCFRPTVYREAVKGDRTYKVCTVSARGMLRRLKTTLGSLQWLSGPGP